MMLIKEKEYNYGQNTGTLIMLAVLFAGFSGGVGLDGAYSYWRVGDTEFN